MRRISCMLILICLMGGVLAGPASGASDASATSEFLIEWAAPAYHVSTVIGGDGRYYSRIEVDAEAYVNSGAVGGPSLPRTGSLVVLPPGGEFGLELLEVVYEPVALAYPVEPAPASTPLQLDADGEPLPGRRVFTRDEALYSDQQPVPAEPVALGDAAWMRDHRLARIGFNPFRYFPAQNRLDVVRRLRLRVWWEPSVDTADSAAGASALDDDLARLVLNPADLGRFRAMDRSAQIVRQLAGRSAYSADQRAGPQAATAYKVLVDREGVYALDYAVLVSAGLPVGSIDPATLRLSHGAAEIAAQWEGDADASFEAGERLLFYARPQLTRYADHDVYWLSWGQGPGRRMQGRSGAPMGLPDGTAWATIQSEENAEYDSLYADHAGDYWFWRRLQLPDQASQSVNVTLDTPAPGATSELTVWLQGVTKTEPDPDHHVRARVNGAVVGDFYWDAKTAFTGTLSLPAGLLQTGANTVQLGLPGDTGSQVEAAWLDALTIRHGLAAVSGNVARFRGESPARAYTVGGFSGGKPRAYDVTDPANPRVVTDYGFAGGAVNVGDHGATPAEYLVLSEGAIMSPLAIGAAKTLADPPDGADYLIVTHPDFQAALAPLVAHRTQAGLRVEMVDVEAVYDQYGDGRMHPEAIRSYLAHAYANWSGPTLQYVLLVGDGTYDPRGYKADTQATYLPPYLAHVDPELGETAADNRYADLSGDLLPELRLGRFPVNTPAEAQAIVDKIIRYESDPLAGPWNQFLLFGADNPSTAGNHHDHADTEYDAYVVRGTGRYGARVYLSETFGAPHLYTNAQAARDVLIERLNFGALLYTYFGHASWHQEAVLETDGYAPLFHRDHIAQLDNERRWPVVLHMTCLTGRYTHRTSNTLDETLLRTKDVGAVAVWGASGNGVATGHRVLHRAFYQAVFDHGQNEFSAAVRAALIQLYAVGNYNDLIETYHAFGDPAMALNMTLTDLPFFAFLPIIGLGN